MALAALPFRIDLLPNGGHQTGPRVILVHGTPILNTLYGTEDRPDDFCLKMAAHAGAKAGDAIAFGHTHKPWHREIEGIHFVNTGSVGRPKDGDWRAGYVLLEIGAGPVQVEFVRVAYDPGRGRARNSGERPTRRVSRLPPDRGPSDIYLRHSRIAPGRGHSTRG